MKLGIVGSSNGGALRAFLNIVKETGKEIDVSVVTDRPCGMEDLCREMSLPYLRIPYSSCDDFSRSAAEFFERKQGIEAVFLFYTRMIGSPLYSHFLTLNLHEALLPEFPGLHAISRFLKSDAQEFGCTLHIVDETLDGGPIVAQAKVSRQIGDCKESLSRVAFWQKVYLMCVALSLLEKEDTLPKGLLFSPPFEIQDEGLMNGLRTLDKHQTIGMFDRYVE